MIPLRDSIPSRRFPIVLWLIIAANTTAFFFEVKLPPPYLSAFLNVWGMVPARFFHPHLLEVTIPNSPWITILTAMFLHGGWMHFIGNMWILYIFGDNVEDRLGHFRFLVFYILSGVAAQLLHLFLHPNSTVPTIGASGAIAGVMGAYFVLFPFAKVLVMVPILFYPLLFEVPAVIYLFVWFFSQLFNGMLALSTRADAFAGIAFWAHVGGFVAGIIFLDSLLKRPRRPGARPVRG